MRILLRADSGFARNALMTWCERHAVDFLFGLARNARLSGEIEAQMIAARGAAETTGEACRRFRDFTWSTRDSWTQSRRVVGKAEWLPGQGGDKANPRFVVTSLAPAEAPAQHLYEGSTAPHGKMENRIKDARQGPEAQAVNPPGNFQPAQVEIIQPALTGATYPQRFPGKVWLRHTIRVKDPT